MFLLYICNSYAVRNVIIVLGSHDDNILNERVDSTINYIINNSDEQSTLYLSGGVKEAFDNDYSESESEAFKMNKIFSSNYDVEIVQDQLAKSVPPRISPI